MSASSGDSPLGMAAPGVKRADIDQRQGAAMLVSESREFIQAGLSERQCPFIVLGSTPVVRLPQPRLGAGRRPIGAGERQRPFGPAESFALSDAMDEERR